MAVRKDGAFFEIALPNGKFSYGRILPKAGYAFYDVYLDERITDIDALKNKDILFITAVYKFAITKERWIKIGHSNLEPKLQTQPMKFIEDALNPGYFELYDPNTGEITPATKDKCIGLERAAVWEPEHIEERIVAHYEGRPSKFLERLKLK